MTEPGNGAGPEDGVTRDDADDAAIAAGEYALGLLEGEEKAAAEARFAADPAFRGLVEDWELQFAGFLAGSGAVAPPPAVKARLDTVLFGAPAPAAPAAQPKTSAVLAFWRFAALGSAALAASLALALTLTLSTRAPRPADGVTLVAALAPADAPGALIVRIDASSGEIEVPALESENPESVGELWLIPASGQPASLGVFALGAPARVALGAAAAAQIAAGLTLAISLEPPGGSPTGAPTGPVVAIGSIERL